eukprot:scaffold12537_cov75-Skeletonema_marinoi.AAC.1
MRRRGKLGDNFDLYPPKSQPSQNSYTPGGNRKDTPFECGKEKAFDTTCDEGEGDLGGQIEMNILQQEG